MEYDDKYAKQNFIQCKSAKWTLRSQKRHVKVNQRMKYKSELIWFKSEEIQYESEYQYCATFRIIYITKHSNLFLSLHHSIRTENK